MITWAFKSGRGSRRVRGRSDQRRMVRNTTLLAFKEKEGHEPINVNCF